jgi:flagellar hook-length control protein FliK
MHQGTLSAKIEADTPAARSALLDSLPVLRERLAEQQIRVEKFDVDVGRDSQSGDGQGPWEHDSPENREQRRSAAAAARTRRTTEQNSSKEAANATVRTLPTSTDGLDVRI